MGAAAVELALVLPVLLLVLFGIIDLGRMLHAQITLTESAREGARAAALRLDPAARVAQTSGGLNGVTIVRAEQCAIGAGPGSSATVVLSEPFEPITPLGSLLAYFGEDSTGAVTITATGVMPCVA